MAFSTRFVARLAEKLPNFLKKKATSDPTFITKLVSKINTSDAKAKVVETAGSIMEWVKKNPANVITMSAALASLGVNVVSLVKEVDHTDTTTPASIPAEDWDLADRIDSIGADSFNRARKEAESNIIGYGRESESARLNISDPDRLAEIETARQILKFAKQFFGSAESAQRAHVMMQAFFEMSLQDVSAGFKTLNV